ncbi:hypothetical protein H0H93_014055 [Arthromyces matolae]|nr:hypothetical protein H0H93_014055 [Arthromyces matolae]
MTPMRRNLPTIVIILVVLSGFYYFSFGDSRPNFPTNIQSLHETLHTRPSFASRPKNAASTSTTIETTIPTDQFVYGFGIFDRIYLRKGTFYIVTSDPSRFPQRKSIIARPLDSGPDVDRDPTDKELQIIDLVEANQILGEQAVVLDGFTVVEYDTDQFMTFFNSTITIGGAKSSLEPGESTLL